MVHWFSNPFSCLMSDPLYYTNRVIKEWYRSSMIISTPDLLCLSYTITSFEQKDPDHNPPHLSSQLCSSSSSYQVWVPVRLTRWTSSCTKIINRGVTISPSTILPLLPNELVFYPKHFSSLGQKRQSGILHVNSNPAQLYLEISNK